MARINCNQVQLQALLNAWFTPAAPANEPHFVVVVDVGQGNLNAVFNAEGRPFLYFDFGGGIDGSLYTYPDPEVALCYAAAPKFILSHWDGDHIKMIDPEIVAGRIGNSEWLAPTQEAWRAGLRLRLSTRAKAVRAQISGGGRDLNLWPDDPANAVAVASVTASHFTVVKVSGNDMNNHSLALRIASWDGNGDRMLLTGDATYQVNTFAHNCTGLCVGLVSSHHGAQVHDAASIPLPQAAATHALAYSFGWGNAYGHPSTAGVDAYDAANWVDPHRLDTGGGEKLADYGGPRGNVGLLWRTVPRGPCRGDNPLTDPGRDDGAIQLIAAASAEAVRFAPLTSGHAAVAAAHRAADLALAPDIARAMVLPWVTNLGAAVPLATRALAQGALQPALAAAVTRVPAAAAADDAAVRLLADAVVNAVLTAAAQAALAITNAAVNAGGGNIGSQSRRASVAAYALVTAGALGLIPQLEAVITNALADAVINAANAIDAANVPTRAQLRAAIADTLCVAASHVIGHTAGAPFPGIQYAKLPPQVASVLVPGLVRADLNASIAAAAALAPAAAVNPEAGPPPNANPVLAPAYHWNVAHIGAVAAIVAVRTGGEPAPRAAIAAVAAARVAYPAARGAPLIACHRHPNNCPAPCGLAIHYAAI